MEVFENIAVEMNPHPRGGHLMEATMVMRNVRLQARMPRRNAEFQSTKESATRRYNLGQEICSIDTVRPQRIAVSTLQCHEGIIRGTMSRWRKDHYIG